MSRFSFITREKTVLERSRQVRKDTDKLMEKSKHDIGELERQLSLINEMRLKLVTKIADLERDARMLVALALKIKEIKDSFGSATAEQRRDMILRRAKLNAELSDIKTRIGHVQILFNDLRAMRQEAIELEAAGQRVRNMMTRIIRTMSREVDGLFRELGYQMP